MIIKIKLSDVVIEVDFMYKMLAEMCNDYIVEDSQKSQIRIKVGEEDIQHELIQVETYENNTEIRESTYSNGYLETLAVYRKIAVEMLNYNTMLVHGSVVSTYKGTVMFVAKSGTGKSTQTKQWLKSFPNSYVINGDKPLLKINRDSVYVYGTPWAGKEAWNKNTNEKLNALCFLVRDESYFVQELTKSEAFSRILNYCYKDNEPEHLKKTLLLANHLVQNVKCYEVHCDNRDICSADLIYNKIF